MPLPPPPEPPLLPPQFYVNPGSQLVPVPAASPPALVPRGGRPPPSPSPRGAPFRALSGSGPQVAPFQARPARDSPAAKHAVAPSPPGITVVRAGSDRQAEPQARGQAPARDDVVVLDVEEPGAPPKTEARAFARIAPAIAPAPCQGQGGNHHAPTSGPIPAERWAGEKAACDTVIQVGRRAGTVEYWRSSLQMPKTSGVKKNSAKKVSVPVKNVAKALQEGDAPSGIGAPVVKVSGKPPVMRRLMPKLTPSPSSGPPLQRFSGPLGARAILPVTAPISVPLLAPRPTPIQPNPAPPPAAVPAQEKPRGPFPSNRGLVNPYATRTPLDTGQKYEFWRTATKLPSVSSAKARQKRLQSSRQRMTSVSRPPALSGAPGPSDSTGSAVNMQAEVQPRHPAQTANPDTVGYPGRRVDTKSSALRTGQLSTPQVAEANQDHQSAATPVVKEGPDPVRGHVTMDEEEITPQMVIDQEQSEMRRLHMTKDYELKKLESYAESRYHVKMNLRGRHKLQKWISTGEDIAVNSVLFLALVLNLDRRLVSESHVDRQSALEEMENEHLRMLEALMARTSTRDGHTNWSVLTENFKHFNRMGSQSY